MTDPTDSPKAKGGRARAAALTPEERREIAAKAAAARWKGDLPIATHAGELQIGDMVFPCSVLSDGTRILTQTDFMKGMGMYYSGWVAQKQSQNESAAEVPHFLAFKALEPFIDRHLGDLQSISVKYRTGKGNIAHGIKAEIIPKICDVWLDAEEHGRLGKRQKQIVQRAKLLMRSLAHVGIIALVDEATGYQELRDKRALQQILDRYLQKELAAWAKRFPDDFYREMFRLRGWQWKGMKVNRPSIVGKYTNDLVYQRIAPGLLEELQRRNPRESSGRRKHKHHQWLSEDVGHPALAQHLYAVVSLMKASSNWNQFKLLVDRALPAKGATLELDLEETSE